MNDLGSPVFDVRIIVWSFAFAFAVLAVYWICLGALSIYRLLSDEPNEVAASGDDPPDTDDQHLHLVE